MILFCISRSNMHLTLSLMEGVMKTELHGKENPGKKLSLLLAPHPSTLLTPPLTRGPKLRAATRQRRDMIPWFSFSSLTSGERTARPSVARVVTSICVAVAPRRSVIGCFGLAASRAYDAIRKLFPAGLQERDDDRRSLFAASTAR